MDPKLPKKIGRYEIRAELGRGMMGVVYEADDPVLGRTLALKTIELGFVIAQEERKAFEERFLTEARAAARLSHPGIVVVYDAGADPDTGQFFMALEYLHGRTLDTFTSYVKSYMDAGGMQWQFNVISSDTLRAAMDNPDDYRWLIVRISGYNAYFVNLNRDMQMELIRRTEYRTR